MSEVQNGEALVSQTPKNGAPDASSNGANAPLWHVTPELDVYESENEYLIRLNVPGATPESVNIQAVGAELHVRAEQAPVAGQDDVALAAFERHLELPSEVDASSASAQLRDGVLEIKLQKSAAARRVRIPVSAN